MNIQNSLKAIVVALATSILSGCVSGPTQQQLTNADYGRDIEASECVRIAEQTISNGLKDPSSAIFRHSPCFKGYAGSVPLMGMGVAFGWLQTGQVNAKNSYGGYVGFRKYHALIKNGQVIRYCISDKDGLCLARGR